MARIYIADDETDIRNLLTFTLVDEGHEVQALKDGGRTLQAVLEDPPDLLILDIMMPVLDGFGVLDELSERGVRHFTRVLMLTARGGETDRVEGFQHGADLYLSKPFSTEELLASIELLLTTTPQQLEAQRDQEKHKASLLAQLESVFGS